MRVQALHELQENIEVDYRNSPEKAEPGSRYEQTWTFRSKHASPFPLRIRVTIKPNWVVEHGIGSAHLPNPAADTLIGTDTVHLLVLGQQPESTSWLFQMGERDGENYNATFLEVIGFAETAAAGDTAVPVESPKSGSALVPSQILQGGPFQVNHRVASHLSRLGRIPSAHGAAAPNDNPGISYARRFDRSGRKSQVASTSQWGQSASFERILQTASVDNMLTLPTRAG